MSGEGEGEGGLRSESRLEAFCCWLVDDASTSVRLGLTALILLTYVDLLLAS